MRRGKVEKCFALKSQRMFCVQSDRFGGLRWCWSACGGKPDTWNPV